MDYNKKLYYALRIFVLVLLFCFEQDSKFHNYVDSILSKIVRSLFSFLGIQAMKHIPE